MSPEPGDGNTGDTARTGSEGDSDLQRDAQFWKEVEVDGDWAEYYPTLGGLADAADAVIVGRFSSIERYSVEHVDEPGDLVAEALVTVDVEDVLRHELGQNSVGLTLLLPYVIDEDSLKLTLAHLQSVLPQRDIVLLLRQREPGIYRLVNGYGLWTRTARTELDTPIIPEPPSEGGYPPELENFESLEDLVEFLRQ